MVDPNRDHIALNFDVGVGSASGSPTNEYENSGSDLLQTRKSCRRYWNQLPRCQRNLIIFGAAAICLTFVLFLPGEQIISDNGKDSSGEHINIAPFKEYDRRLRPRHAELEDQTIKPLENVNQKSSHNEAKERGLDFQSLQSEAVIKNAANVAIAVPFEDTVNLADQAAKEVVNQLDLNPVSDVTSIDFKGPQNERQRAVVEAFKHSWKAYKEFAWGHDNLKPISMAFHDWFGLGLTIVDSLDTMYIMNLQEEFDEARNWVDQYLLFDINRDVNLFEVTIRVLGGLLSSYHLSGDKMFLKKSIDLGNRLLPSFNSPSGIPFSDVNLGSMVAHSPKWSPDSSTSEVTTLQLEFRDISRVTGNAIYEEVAHKVNEKVHALEKTNGLVPIFINANTGTFRSFSTISLGARGDSYYEYLIKQWIQTGRKSNDFLILDYMNAIEGVLERLVKKTPKEKYTYIGELINGKEFKPKMDHLTCYLPGTLLLGHKYGMPNSHLQLAHELLQTCYQTYMEQPTGLAPEITYFNTLDDGEPDIQVKSNDAHNLQRPEFVESLWYFYAITGNRTYQDMGWNVFQAFEKYTKVTNGYTSIGNVKKPYNTRPRDMMESFWLGETLKYFYLLFSDDRNEIDLNKFVMNTEAHPLPIRDN